MKLLWLFELSRTMSVEKISHMLFTLETIPLRSFLLILWVLFSFTIAGCISESTHQEPSVRDWKVIDLADSSLYGLWEMKGYGRLVHISPDTLVVYHHVDDFCIVDRGIVPPLSLYSMDEQNDTLSLLYQNYGARSEVLQTRIDSYRLEEFPNDCNSSEIYADATPQQVFDLFWTAFNEHYAFFNEREVNWLDQRDRFDSRVDTVGSIDGLFTLLSEMVEPLSDGHVRISQGQHKSFNAGISSLGLRNRIIEKWAQEGKPGEDWRYVGDWHRSVHGSVYDLLDDGSLQKGAAGALEWGTLNKRVAYVRINRFNALAGPGVSRPAQLDTLHANLKRLRGDIDIMDRVIIDVTLNSGGMDPAAIIAASYFADQRRHALTKTIKGAHSTTVFIEPEPGYEFSKPIYLLTSEVTASAAEGFVLMMRSLPHVTHVGRTTRGDLSGLLPKQLPQQFAITISNESVLDPKGMLYEGGGVPPEVDIDLFPDDSLHTGLANVLKRLASSPQ